VGFAKPEPPHYQAILDDLGCAAKHALFIDDHEPNVGAQIGPSLDSRCCDTETSGESLRVITAEHGLSLA
jgi:hypothetical protein